MFGFGNKNQNTADDDKKQAQIDQAKKAVKEYVAAMRGEISPVEAERLSQKIKDRCGATSILPFDFRQHALALARELECNANMRQSDALLHLAGRLATEENMKERGLKLSEARQYFAKACTLGADPHWRGAFQRMTEAVLLTGGVHHKGPSRAKPLDMAPKAPNRAKG